MSRLEQLASAVDNLTTSVQSITTFVQGTSVYSSRDEQEALIEVASIFRQLALVFTGLGLEETIDPVAHVQALRLRVQAIRDRCGLDPAVRGCAAKLIPELAGLRDDVDTTIKLFIATTPGEGN